MFTIAHALDLNHQRLKLLNVTTPSFYPILVNAVKEQDHKAAITRRVPTSSRDVASKQQRFVTVFNRFSPRLL